MFKVSLGKLVKISYVKLPSHHKFSSKKFIYSKFLNLKTLSEQVNVLASILLNVKTTNKFK